jgi:hypothetical protein
VFDRADKVGKKEKKRKEKKRKEKKKKKGFYGHFVLLEEKAVTSTLQLNLLHM